MDLFISSDASICSTTTLPSLEKSDHVLVSVCNDFLTNYKQDAPFYCIAYAYSRANWDDLHDHMRDDSWDDITKLRVSADASEFCEWVQVGIDVDILHGKYQVKPHSSQ